MRRCNRDLKTLIESEFGKKAKRDVFSEVTFPKKDDERSVVLSPDMIQRLIECAPDPLYAEYIRLAVSSGIDVKPICAIKPEHFASPDLEVLDTKTSTRRRRIELSIPAQTALTRAMTMTGAKEGQLVFGYTYNMVRKRWVATVERADMKDVRLKDLRGVCLRPTTSWPAVAPRTLCRFSVTRTFKPPYAM